MQRTMESNITNTNKDGEDGIKMKSTSPQIPLASDSLRKDYIANKKKEVNEATIAFKLRRFLEILRKKFVEDHWLGQYVSARGNFYGTRIYQIWSGNNVFFCHGHLICGPDPRGLMLTTMSIILSNLIFATSNNPGDDSPSNSSLIVVISMILMIIVLVNLLAVSAFDPGIIPRNYQSPIGEIGNADGARRKIVIINGVEVKRKFCRVCNIFRPPRSCHCTVCNNCVDRFDHHCPWIGQCIAIRNYRFYLMFVITAFVYFGYICGFSCWRIHRRMQRNGIGLLGTLKNYPEAIALVFFSFAATWFLFGLFIFHLYLIAINQTSYEKHRQRYVTQNPFDKGVLSNVKEVLFSPFTHSRIDFRAQVHPQIGNPKDEMKV